MAENKDIGSRKSSMSSIAKQKNLKGAPDMYHDNE